ncbi:hypothetical protein MBAV_006455 [Candidatus Magnetobacterium bavaricum]|uniref:Uncharacterized protein n=1 Tax=Candidatus Magnetobacterium bavaricum TaxID=29290 RepID=A0A0F3GHM7_9BACT|nr:hypothetical protein MBAV_006455 [Candidatus Magnetobacterium bavaricum]
MKEVILALPTKNISKIKKLFPNELTISWLYIGDDFLKLHPIEEKLGENFKRIDISRLIDDISTDIRYDFIKWMDDVNTRNGYNIEWWFGTISGRDMDTFHIFQYICYIKVIEHIYQKHKRLPDLIFVESIELANIIEEWALKKGCSIKHLNSFVLFYRKVFTCGLYVLQWCKFLFVICIRLIAAYVSHTKHNLIKTTNHHYAIIDTFIHFKDISESGVFDDRYYPHLYEFMAKKEISVLVHPVMYGIGYRYMSIYKRMRKSKTVFLIREDFLHISDYLNALLYPIRLLCTPIKHGNLLDINVASLLKETKFNSFLFSMEAILIYRLFIRLGKTKIKPDIVINWYENQVIDKALISGVRKAFPTVQILGVQMFIHTPNTLNTYPIQSEVDYNITPDTIIGIGEFNHKKALTFTKNIKCQIGAALRYANVFCQKEENNNAFDKQHVLIILPYDLGTSVELLEKFCKAIKSIAYNNPILIKCHQCYTPKHLIDTFGKRKWLKNFTIYTGKLEDAFQQTILVVSANTSAIVEAITYGIPVIYSMRQTGLNNNMLSGLNIEFMDEIFTETELTASLIKYLNISIEKRQKFKLIGTKIRDMFFTPINDKTMTSFISLILQ